MKARRSLHGALALCVMSWTHAAVADDGGSTVERCTKSFGTLAVAESQTGWSHLSQYGLGSPAALLRMMVQKSGCFDVVERGMGMQNLQQERAMAQSGDLRQDSNLGKGQMQAADFVMTPAVQIGAQTTGGLGGAVLGRLGVFGALAGGLKFKEASTSLLVSDVRSSLQVAAAEGKATKTDFSIGGWGLSAAGLGGASGYTSSPEGKVVAASLLDNYNRIVLSIRDQPQLIKPSSAAGDVNAAASTRAEAPQQPGQVLQTKIANVKVYEEPSRDSKVLGTLQRSDDLVATGEAKNGFVRVDSANLSGWVQRTLVGPASGSSSAAPAPTQQAVAPIQTVASTGLPTFAGSYSGSDQGSFQIMVGAQGVVTGSGTSASGGAFNIRGRLDSSGALLMNAGTTLYNGRIDPNTGAMSGSWQYLARQSGGGNFSGQRQN
jgi:curli biogenesis system outer membrane secretion channel CsgG